MRRQSKLQSPPQSNFLKRWFLNSETILAARLTQATGFVIAVGGSLDFSPLLGMTGFHRSQAIWLGSIILVQGVLIELARRRRASTDPVSN